VKPVPRYLVETLVPPAASAECTRREWRARSIAAELRRQGVRVCFERAISTPEDGICVIVLAAASEREAALTAELAELAPFRVVEASASTGRKAVSTQSGGVDARTGV
jgi:hypothetical protein